ncbi:MAG: DNA polymerase I, partial [Clostridia bacterium]|nr:DNA polymerase I [Clostridia bacterium]
MDKLILIDGNSLLNRAYYATPVFTTQDGTPTNGVFGFVKLLLKIIADKKPTHVAVAFDVHAKTFRHKMYDDYKAGRKPMPDDLAVQMPILKEILAAMNIRICEMAGYEADDVIGTLAKRFSMQTFIYTGDRDAYQLVDATTNVCYTKRGVSDLLELSEENFYDEIGLSPSQIIDLKALMGDKSDNIPGVAGVGEKSAYSLLAAYNDLDGVYANIEEIKGALQKKLIDNKETAYFSKQLATINTDAPIEVKIEECLLKMPFGAKVKEQFANLEFKSLLSMDIFSSESDENTVSALIEPAVSETTLETVQAALKLCDEFQEERIAVDWTDKGFRFFLRHKKPEIEKECVEYFLPIKEGLLDVGVYEYQLVPLLKAVFSGEKKVIVYN